MILKAGTYKWKNETLTNFPTTVNTVYGRIPVYYEGELFGYLGIGTLSNYEYPNGVVNGYFVGMVKETGNDFGEPVYLEGSIGETTYNGWIGVPSSVTLLTADTEVDDVFGNWYIDNTNYNEVNGIVTSPIAEITYNGETVAQLNAGETATLSCEGKKMASDVVVKVNKIEEPKDDSNVGTWVLNDTLTDYPIITGDVEVELRAYIPSLNYGIEFLSKIIDKLIISKSTTAAGNLDFYIAAHIPSDDDASIIYHFTSGGGHDIGYSVDFPSPHIIQILEEPSDGTFKTWLKTNATKIGGGTVNNALTTTDGQYFIVKESE